MNEIQTDRHEALVRATRPGMVQPWPAHLTALDTGAVRQFHRDLQQEYQCTHNLLGDLRRDDPLTPTTLIDAVDNHQRAHVLLQQAKAMPRTRLGARIRALAADNADVALEVLQVIANQANRAPKLN